MVSQRPPKPGVLRLSVEGARVVEKAILSITTTIEEFVSSIGTNRVTLWRFKSREGIKEGMFIKICVGLGVSWREVCESSDSAQLTIQKTTEALTLFGELPLRAQCDLIRRAVGIVERRIDKLDPT